MIDVTWDVSLVEMLSSIMVSNMKTFYIKKSNIKYFNILIYIKKLFIKKKNR